MTLHRRSPRVIASPKPRRYADWSLRRLWDGKRGTLIDYVCVAACFAVFAVILYRGLVQTFRAEGLPGWADAYLAWEKRHTPDWFVHLFDRFY